MVPSIIAVTLNQVVKVTKGTVFSIASNSLSYITPYQNKHHPKNKNLKSSIKY